MKVLFADATELASTTYGIIRRKSDGFYRRFTGGSFEAYNAANFTDYDHPVTESGASGLYEMTFPDIVESGGYHVFILRQAGGSPAPGDEVLWEETVWWNGAESTPPPPPGGTPGRVTAYLYTYDENGVLESGVNVTVKVTPPLPDTLIGFGLDTTPRTEVSDGSGFVQFTNMFKGVKYEVTRGTTGQEYEVTIPDDAVDPFALGPIAGSP